MSDRYSDRAEWLRQAFAGEASAVTMVLMRRFGVSEEDAVDAVQEAYLRLDARLRDPDKPYPDHVPLRQYILGAARSYISHRRERESRVERHEELLWSLIDPEADPLTQAITREQRQLLRQAIRTLKAADRAVFEKLLDKSMTLAEIARELEIPLQSIYVKYSRGLEKLRKRIRKM